MPAVKAAAASISLCNVLKPELADLKILRLHQSADSDHRSATASADRCCLGSTVSPRVRDSLSDPLYTHGRPGSRSAVCPIHLSVAGSLKYNERLQLRSMVTGLTGIERVRQHLLIVPSG